MFFYDNQLELDEASQLPLAHVSTIRFDRSDSSRAWLGCSDGAIYRFDTNSLQADHQFAYKQCVADLFATDSYLLCLSKNYVKLFDIQQLASSNDSSKCDLDDYGNKRKNRKRYLNGELKCDTSRSISHLVKLGSRSALSCLCEQDKDRFLFGGAQSELLLFDAHQLKLINRFPLCSLYSGLPSSCVKMKRIGSKNLITTSTLSGRMVTTYLLIHFLIAY